ncbi:OB-fold protein [Chondrinema litorale]|uniref:OB-fold protein n=1 Tax=Chondrinema litorale TaxID=2994555 RepID=UPI002543B10A|nr:hypothetical protein [Chondrinema litorale]UZR99304.1 hypothetical protein OQ292_36165 [Chondrinema litorale]
MPAELARYTLSRRFKIKIQDMIKYIFNCQTIAVLFVLSLCWFSFNQAQVFNKRIAYHLSAEQVFEEFTLNNPKAIQKYLDKELYVSGKVQRVAKNDKDEIIVYLGPSKMLYYLKCIMDKESSSLNKELKEGMWVGLTGVCTGYTMNVDLSNCQLVNP